MASRFSFGTDGVRGRFGQFPITTQACLALGEASLDTLQGVGVLIAADTRQSGHLLASALAEGFQKAGLSVQYLGVLPTPVLAWACRRLGMAGAMVSASHNPASDNGIKLLAPGGGKLSDKLQDSLALAWQACYEAKGWSADLDQTSLSLEQLSVPLLPINTPLLEEIQAGYQARLVDYFGDKALSGLAVGIDSANGAFYQLAPKVLLALGAKVHAWADKPNGHNINEHSGSTYPDLIAKAVDEHQLDMGLSFDGDGDRVAAALPGAQALDGDDLLWLLYTHLKAQGQAPQTMVGTLMTNTGLEKALSNEGVRLIRSAVGDRYLSEAMKESGAVLGGENSGHLLPWFIEMNQGQGGDGLLVGILAALAVQAGCKLDWPRYAQVLKGVPYDPACLDSLLEALSPLIQKAELELKQVGGGRVLVRPSGTEPVIRVMVEAADAAIAQAWCDRLCQALSASPA